MRLPQLKALIQGSRLEPVARELLRTAWQRWRLIDDRERYIAQILSYVLTESSCCVDVGCHVGTILEHFVRLAPRGHHYAYEALPDLAPDLRRRLPQVEVHEVAISDRAGEAEFHHVTCNPGTAVSGATRTTLRPSTWS